LWDATEAPSRPVTPHQAEPVSPTAHAANDTHDTSTFGPTDEATAIERLNAMVQEQIAPTVAAPAEMDDPIAQKTNWGHMSTAGGGNIRSHILVEVRPSRLEFRAPPQALALYCIPLLLGVGLIVMFVDVPFFGRLASDSTTTAPPCMVIPFGLLFATAGIWLLRHGTEPIVFDVGRGQYWKGRSSRFGTSSPHDLADFVELSRVHALQLVSQRHEDSDSLRFDHEINLVLDDGARMHVLSHGDRAAIRRDAQRLAAAIGRPVWDQTRVGT